MGVEPLYVTVAAELREKIEGGEYPIGSTIPTEHELCERFAISRFTARAALQKLVDAGLVARRPRAGTTVIADRQREPFAQTLRSLDDLLQYATDTTFEIIELGKARARHRPRFLPADIDVEGWAMGTGLRYRIEDQQPVSLTQVFVPEKFAAIFSARQDQSAAFYRVLEMMFDLTISRVDQYISATNLSRDNAGLLKLAQGDAALIITRIYYAEDGDIVEISESIHPAGQFVYKSEIVKQ